MGDRLGIPGVAVFFIEFTLHLTVMIYIRINEFCFAFHNYVLTNILLKHITNLKNIEPTQ